jgi:NodT family efflux transporter outer membrane factor (OMF) lipoprotein
MNRSVRTNDWRRSKRRRSLGGVRVVCALACLLAGGCEWAKNGFKVGPNYVPPPAPVAEQWIDYQQPELAATTQPATQPSSELSRWWHVFGDPVLDSLVSDAYDQNLSLRAAGERIAEARAVRGIAGGNMFPQTQDVTADYAAVKASNRAATTFNEQWFSNYSAGFNVGWELDFWGRFRRGIEAADASLDASVANYDDVLTALLADVAANYIQYRTFQERLALMRVNVRIQEQSYQLANDNFRFGQATERDAQQARQVLEQTKSNIPQLETGLRLTNNALCVLMGLPLQDLSPRLGESGMIPIGRPNWGVGIPADLLRRRPDVRRAERETAAQSAAIGIAKADLYPRFSLIGSVGLQAEDFNDLFDTPGSLTGFIGPSFQWNILNYGRIENSVKVQEARFRQLFFNYQAAVLRANREAEDAIIGYLKSQQRVKYLVESVGAAQRTVDITYDQYKQGVIDFTPVFLFEATLTSQQDALAQARADIALSLVDLYRSLGGGWEAQYEANGYAATRPTTAPTTRRAEGWWSTTNPGMAYPSTTRPVVTTRPSTIGR